MFHNKSYAQKSPTLQHRKNLEKPKTFVNKKKGRLYLKILTASIPKGSFFSWIQTICKSSFRISMSCMTYQLLELCEIACGFL